MCTLIREVLGGPWTEHHRTGLLQHLDHVLGQLGMGPEHLRQQDLGINEVNVRQREGQYRKLKGLAGGGKKRFMS